MLRAEKGFVIVGQDTDGSVTPQDLGMDWICAKHKDFLGKRSLTRPDCLRNDRKQLVGLLTENPNEVLPEGAQLTNSPKAPVPVPMIGHVSSSYFSACLGHSIALALVRGGQERLGRPYLRHWRMGELYRQKLPSLFSTIQAGTGRMSERPVPESPLAHSRLPQLHGNRVRAGVVLEEHSLRTHLNLRGNSNDAEFANPTEEVLKLSLPVQPNTVSHRQDLMAAWLAPDEWLLIAGADVGKSLKLDLDSRLAHCHYALNDLSGGQTMISISGPQSLDLLAKGCTLDLHPRVFGAGQCAQSHLAKASVTIVARASNLSAYDVVVRRSFADYLWRWLIKAGSEYGISTD